MAFDREGLLSIRTRAKLVMIPDYGDIYLRVMTLAETAAWQKKAQADDPKILISLLSYTLSDENGKRLFKDDEVDLISQSMEYPLVDALFDQAMVFNKLRKEDKTAKATAEAAKN